VVEETTAQGFWDCSPMKPRTRPCAIPWAAGDGQYQSGAHGAVFGPPVSDVRTDTAGPDAHSRCSDGFQPAGRWTGNFQADLSSGIAWAFNPGQTTVSQP